MPFTWKSIWVLQPKISSHYVIVNVWIGQKDVSSAQKLTTFLSQWSGWNALGKPRVFFSLGKRVMGITLNFAKVTISCVFCGEPIKMAHCISGLCGFISMAHFGTLGLKKRFWVQTNVQWFFETMLVLCKFFDRVNGYIAGSSYLVKPLTSTLALSLQVLEKSYSPPSLTHPFRNSKLHLHPWPRSKKRLRFSKWNLTWN